MTTKYKLFPIEMPVCYFDLRVGEARDLLASFVKIIPQRMDQLGSVADVSWVYDQRPIGDLMPSFRRFCKWVLTHQIWTRQVPPAGSSRIIISRDATPAAAKYLRDLERSQRDRLEDVETPIGLSIIFDFGIAYCEYFRIRNPWLKWTFDDRRSIVTYGEPAIGWFGDKWPQVCRFRAVAGMLYRHSDMGGSLATLIAETIQRITPEIRQPAKNR